MVGQLVIEENTTYNAEEFIKALIIGWKIQFGSLPSKQTVAVLWAQTSIELGDTIVMNNNNVTNAVYNVNLMPNANYYSDNNGNFYLAFPNLPQGLAYYLNFLMTSEYQAAWSAVLSGNPAQFVNLLATESNYPNEENYLSAFLEIYNAFMQSHDYEVAVKEINAYSP